MAPGPAPVDPLGLLGQALDGRYQIVAYIGGGEIGHVYRAEQAALHRACVIKVLRPEVQSDQARRSRVLHGSQQIARLHLDRLVAPDDLLVSPERTAIVTPLLTGEDLGAYLRRMRGPLPWPETRDILQQVVIALSELHAAGLVFAGLKPSNVFLAHSDAAVQIRLLDVGTSRHDVATASVAYMAPEWAAGAVPDASADIYSLGALAHEMLTGQPVFTGTPAQVALMHRFKPPRPLRSAAPDAGIPAHAEALLLRALAKQPHERPDIASLLELVGGAPQPLPGESAQTPVPDAALDEDSRTLAGDLVFTPGSLGVSFRSETDAHASARPITAPRRGPGGERSEDAPREPLRAGAAVRGLDEPETRTIVTGPDGAVLGGDPRSLFSGKPGWDGVPASTSTVVAVPDGAAMLAGLGGASLAAPESTAGRPAMPAPARGLLARPIADSPEPARSGRLARQTAASTSLPARRGQRWFDPLLRVLAEIPRHITRAWRSVTRPFTRGGSLRSKLTAPLLVVRDTFGRLARRVSRWTGGSDA